MKRRSIPGRLENGQSEVISVVETCHWTVSYPAPGGCDATIRETPSPFFQGSAGKSSLRSMNMLAL